MQEDISKNQLKDQGKFKDLRVTYPLLPPLEELQPMLIQIWEKAWLTNHGDYHQMLEKELKDYLKVSNLSLFTNGTLPIITALQALDIKGEVITTPYSFVATSHSIVWNGLQPKFVDVDPVYGNIDPDRIEDNITENTSAILAVHVYGNPCDTDKIGRIAEKHGLKVIYDAAHAFGVERYGKSILLEGDLSTISFHATKTFNTAEGGAMVCNDRNLKEKIDYLTNFGFADEVTVVGPGINSKMDEIRAALGLLNLKYFESSRLRREEICRLYRTHLENIPGIRIMPEPPGVKHNFGYFPVFITDEYGESRDSLYNRLKCENIYGRRYFYPLITEFPPYNSMVGDSENALPTAFRLSREVICLPLHHSLTDEDVYRVIDVIRRNV